MYILIAEDNSDLRKSISELLESSGYSTIEAENGKQAFELIQSQIVDMVISDINMPGMNGMELLQNIKEDNSLKDIIVVLMTGYTDLKDAVNCMKLGAYDYISKPINFEELLLLIERINEINTLKQKNKELSEENNNINKSKRQLEEKIEKIIKDYAKEKNIDEIGIFSDIYYRVFYTASKYQNSIHVPILLEGETGTGKEVMANFIHFGNRDKQAPFIAVNCATMNPNLFENEIFGYEAGSYTGGKTKGEMGKIELADGGTLFLDEITELNLEMQAKLLRVIQERKYYRVGGLKELKVNCRFICSTNVDMEQLVDEGAFREDLYFRLNIGHIKIPPLRNRKNEILPLANMFLRRFSVNLRKKLTEFSKDAQDVLVSYDWPGNVRELKNTLERVSILSETEIIEKDQLDFLLRKGAKYRQKIKRKFSIDNIDLPEDHLELNQFILDIVKKALDAHNGNKTDTAKYLGITRGILYTYLKKINL